MNKESKKNILWCLLLIAVWIPPCFELEIFKETYFYLAAFLVSVIPIYAVKKLGICLALTVMSTVAVAFVDYGYLFTVLPLVMLIYAHYLLSNSKDKYKKEKKNDTAADYSNIFTTAAQILIAGELVYAFIEYGKTDAHNPSNLLTVFKMVPLFIVFFAVLFVEAVNKKNYAVVPKRKADAYAMIYATSFIGAVISAVTFYAGNGYGVQSMKTEYIFWFMYVLAVGINKDIFIDIVFDKAKKLIEGR